MIREIQISLNENFLIINQLHEGQNVLKASLTYKLNANIEIMRRVNRVKPITDNSQMQRSPSRNSLEKTSMRELTDHQSQKSEMEINESDLDSEVDKQEHDYVNQLIKDTKTEVKYRGYTSKSHPQKA